MQLGEALKKTDYGRYLMEIAAEGMGKQEVEVKGR